MEGGQRENIERAVEAFNRGDFESVLELMDPEIEMHDPERTGRVWHGPEGWRAFTQEWLEAFDEYSVEIREIEEGRDGTFVALTQRGKGAGSGIEFELPLHYAIRFRDGRFSYFKIYTRADEAHRDVGLSE
jgi:ketosteroid isomerase-like protein